MGEVGMKHEMSETFRKLLSGLDGMAQADGGRKYAALYVTDEEASALADELRREIDLAWRYRDLQD